MNHNIKGVFWIGEFISTALSIEWCDAEEGGCSDAICYTNLVMDVPNLLSVKFKLFRHIDCKSSIYSVLGTPHFPGDCVQEASVQGSEEKGD